MSTSATLDDASWGGSTDRTGLRANHRDSGAVSVRRATTIAWRTVRTKMVISR
jgi:hypothetical protein